MTSIKIFTPNDLPADERAIQQLKTCMAEGEAEAGVLCADHHVGYSQPIGGAIAYRDYISPSGVGYDIGCGNKAVATDLFYSDINSDLPKIMDEITRRISFGMGQPNREEVKDHPVFGSIDQTEQQNIRDMLPGARKQLGTVGAGNHYVDLFCEEGTQQIWIGVHFGSRGFGHKIASGFMAMAQGQRFDSRPSEGEMDAPPILFTQYSSLGGAYIEAMNLAGEYAYAGRDVVCDKVLEILGNPGVQKEVHNHHNFAWREDGAWVVRKGCTPLMPKQEGFVGGSMGENAVIIRGNGDTDASSPSWQAGAESLWSAPHGAGRVMSRNEAKGKSRKRWTCKDCSWTQGPGEAGLGQTPKCPQCESTDCIKKWIQLSEGKVDWKVVRNRLATQGIELRGGDADEAPEAYKRLPAVLEAHKEYVDVTHQLKPIGVAMAGSDVIDPWKD